LGSLAVHLKATYLQMRIYIWSIIIFILLGRLALFIVSLFIDLSQSKGLSAGNMLILILPLIAIVLPLSYYKRIVHLGASRKQYFKGLQFVFAFWAVAVALFNSLWIVFEVNVLRTYTNTVDLIKAFHWDDFGLAGSFLYQIAFYLMVMALLSMLVSGYYHPVGWLLCALLFAAIPVGTAVPSLRVHVVSFFKTLLFNGSLLAGVGFNLLLYVVFVAGGWLFTRGRTH
jgi:heme/copper-type cytochrome/quinol oxidase subunit 4